MIINKHNLTIAEHCASEQRNGFSINGLQFNKTGTIAINRCYSVAVSALQTVEDEPLACITVEKAKELEAQADNGYPLSVNVEKLPTIEGKIPKIDITDKPTQFEVTLNAKFLLKLAESLCEFDPDAIVRLQYIGPNDPVRMEARNKTTGQKWEAMLMPRAIGVDDARFEEQLKQAVARQEPLLADGVTPNRQARPFPPPPPVDNELAAALAEAQKLAGL